MQAMHQKCNQLIFQTKRSTYHKGEITEKIFSMLCWVYVNKEIAVTKLQYVGYITDIAYMYNCEEPLFNLKMGDIDSVLYNGPLALLAGYKNIFMNERFVLVCSWNSFLVFILIGKYVEVTKASLELGEQ